MNMLREVYKVTTLHNNKDIELITPLFPKLFGQNFSLKALATSL